MTSNPQNTPITVEALLPLRADEWGNHRSMIREAMSKGRDDDLAHLEEHPPTWGSLLDSWEQMPDEIRAEILPDFDLDAVDAFLRTQPSDEPLP